MIGAAQSALNADEAAGEFLDESGQGSAKHPGAFLSIGEAAAALDLPAHVLRYWETQFTGLQPLKRSGGRRFYRPEDIAFLKRLRALLHEQAYTIRGAQRLLANEADGAGAVEAMTVEAGAPMTPLGLQAVLQRAVQAGSFDGVFTSHNAPNGGAPVADMVTRLSDALDLLVEAKHRLDAVRRSA